MNQAKAAGPKTELVGVSSRMQQSIENMIASFSQGVADCMENARTAVPRNSADDCRSSERRDAVQLVSSTAELLSSIAKLKGEFSHNYTITRTSEKERERERIRAETGLENDPRYMELAELLDPDEVEALSDEEREDYFRLLKLPPMDIRRRSETETPAPPPSP